MNIKTSIELHYFTEFKNKFYSNGFPGQRLGQAFYNHFNLHKMNNQEALCKLYEADGPEASQIIDSLFEVT